MTSNTSAGDVYPASQTVPTPSDWLANGYLPLPILGGQKIPRSKHETWFRSLSAAQVDLHWKSCPADDVALHCSNGLVVLDADSKESEIAIQNLEQKHALYSNLKVRTKKGIHYYYKNPGHLQITQAGHSTEEHPERIDIRCGNSYIIAPPSTDKELLVPEIVPFEQLVELTPVFVEDLLKHNSNGATSGVRHVALAKPQANEFADSMDQKLVVIRALISHLDPDEGYSSWIRVLMVIHHETEGSDEGLALADEWSSTGEKYKGTSEIKARWSSFHGRTDSITMGTVRHMLKERGFDPNLILQKALNLNNQEEGSVVHLSNVKGEVQPLEGFHFPHPPKGRSSQLPGSFENFQAIMKGYGIGFRYNEITKKTSIDIPYLETSIDNADNVKRTQVKSVCALNKFPAGPVDNLCDSLGDLNRYNPVKEWINSAKWDGVDRLEDFYATVVVADDFPIEFKKTLMKRWMISAVAAAFQPEGFKCRGVLTFTGKQGIGKTSWVKSLVSDARLREEVILTGHCLDASNKDSKMTAIQNWIVELGELESTLKNELPVLKSFITNDMDTFRRPYAAVDSTYPRRTIFFASVNDTNFLNDITGNSRWWTIPVESVNYQHGLDMQQVFAQVKELYYDKCEQWWLTWDEESQLTALNKESEAISPIKELAVEYLNEVAGGKPEFTTATQFLKVLGIEVTRNKGVIKEATPVFNELFGPRRRSNGNNGWDIPQRPFPRF
jgi:putative DNA primase/helicase